jgi:hypothetical protein
VIHLAQNDSLSLMLAHAELILSWGQTADQFPTATSTELAAVA